MKRRYSPPKWIHARFAATCSCGRPITPKQLALWFAREKRLYCRACGEQYERDLAAANWDELVYSQGLV